VLTRALPVSAAPGGLPLDAIRRTPRLPAAPVGRRGERDSIAVDGEVVPFARLAQVMRRQAGPARRRFWPTVVVQAGGRAAALAVDRLVGTADVVVRRLPAVVQAEPFVAGAALDADGTPRLVLDALGVVQAVAGLEHAVARPAPAPAVPRVLRVLVVDDSLTTRMLEQSILESAGYQVELASSGEEGLAKARAGRFGLFLVDVEMPGIDGFEFVRRSRQDPLLSGTPAILVTSRSSPEDLRRGEEVGARAYIVKGDFDQGVLLGKIRELVR
jgi:two-component system chemotaxis sensor kinase CheA